MDLVCKTKKIYEMNVKTIDPEELFAWIIEERNDYQVVDLRRDDFSAGHVKGSWNYPVQGEMTNTAMNDLVARLLDSFSCRQVTKVIFHCTGSKNRGPRVAAQFDHHCLLNGLEQMMEGYVLVGGYDKWKNLFENVETSTISVD